MKLIFKNIIILVVGKIWFGLALQQRSRIILCFHGIGNKGNKYTVKKSRFISIVNKLSKNYRFVGIHELLNSNTKANLAAITFDDGYKNILLVKDYLQKKNISPTVFIISNRKEAKVVELDSNNALLDITEIKDLINLGWTIGSHSATHANFENLNPKELESEINNSKKELEKRLKIKIEYFAYPKGYCSKKIVSSVKKAGYRYGFTTAPQDAARALPFEIPRFVIEKSDIFGEFPYSFAMPIQFLRRTLKYAD